MKSRSAVIVVLLLGVVVGCSPSTRAESRVKQSDQNIAIGASESKNRSGMIGNSENSARSELLLGIPEEKIKEKIEKNVVIVQADKDKADSSDISKEKAAAEAKDKIANAFDKNLKDHPDFMTKEDAENLKEKLDEFIDQSLAGNSKAASVAWNEFAGRVEKIRLGFKSAEPWEPKKDIGKNVVVVVPGKSGGGLLTRLVGLADRVVDSGIGLVDALLGQPVDVIGTASTDLVNRVFDLLI